MRAMHLVLASVCNVITFVAVTILVAWLLEDVVYFSLLLGIPAGMITAATVGILLVVQFGRMEGRP